MATTNASITIASSDIIPGMAMNYYKTATLHKAGGCTGIEKIMSGTVEYTSTSAQTLMDSSDFNATAQDKANKLYIKNLSTDTTEYATVSMQSEEIGRLYSQDWMFIPYKASGDDHDVRITPSVATSMKFDYVLLYE